MQRESAESSSVLSRAVLSLAPSLPPSLPFFGAVRSEVDYSIAQEAHVFFCFEVLAAHFAGHELPRAPFGADVACPLFVTWKKKSAAQGGHLQLRGCIGCLQPLPLSSLCDYALNSALHDRRFPPLSAAELLELHCTVQLLGRFEPCGCVDWEIGVHGVTISFVDSLGTSRSAVYLPDVMPEQGWNQWQVRARVHHRTAPPRSRRSEVMPIVYARSCGHRPSTRWCASPDAMSRSRPRCASA